MVKNNKTIFQKAIDFFSTDTGESKIQKTVISSKPEEIEQHKKAANQQKFFDNHFGTIMGNQYYDIIRTESERDAAYIDYESMEYYPMIGQALDLLAEEATVANDDGNVLNIYSDDKRIRNELENLFYNKIDIDSQIYPWTRNTVKKGDTFVHCHLVKDAGVVGVTILPTAQITRREAFDTEKKMVTTVFRHDMVNTKYTNIEVLHFRLLGDYSKYPYGFSVLEKLRKLHKMLIIGEDAMMIKRLTRAVMRNIFNIDVGNIEPDDVPAYMEAVMNKFKKVTQVDRSGKTDFRYNTMNVTQDFFIPRRNGNSQTTIESLQGDTNFDIPDIEFLREQMYTGLGIPKAFLSFEEGQGDGKSLANLDVRFARKINRIQKTMVGELNKLAMIHLYFKGYKEDIRNFKLSLNNPSIQGDILKIEHYNQKLSAYASAIAPDEATQIAPMSQKIAKKKILGMSEDEIITDVKAQFFERLIGEEFRNKVINSPTNTGLFDGITDRYKDRTPSITGSTQQAAGQEDATGFGGGGDTGAAGGGENPFESKKRDIDKLLTEYDNYLRPKNTNLDDIDLIKNIKKLKDKIGGQKINEEKK